MTTEMITRRNQTITGAEAFASFIVYEGIHVKVNVVLRMEMKLSEGSLDENFEAF